MTDDQPIRFGRFEIRPRERQLLADGRQANLGARAFDVLLALAARPGQLLTKVELLDIVWPSLFVEENNLQVQISSLRRLLGSGVIATIPGRGYRFTATPVAAGGPAAAMAAESTAAASTPIAAAPAAAEAAARQPVPQRLFGRDADLLELETLLLNNADGACTTLVGAAGVGKSSLARVAMARWAGRAAWVDLAPLTQGAQVAGAVARALGVQLADGEPAPQLLRALQHSEPLLLVLDNAEHLIETVADLVAPLSGFVILRLLVTSQLPLAVRGERVRRLEPLQLPAVDVAGASDPADLGQGALALLVDRIVAADHRFTVTPATRPLLTALCWQLDGLPLALEMVAARVPMMGLQAVNDALTQRFALLTRGRRDAPQRHRTLHDALEWSYRLLGPAEQRLFAALGVFSGGFTLELALALAAESEHERWDVVDRLATLVDRSLVHADSHDPPRYRMLQSVRELALERLKASADDEATLRRRHAAAMRALFAHGPEAACLAEMENTRDAFAWACVHDFGTAVALSARAASVSVFSVWRRETTDWLLSLEPAMRQLPAPESVPAEVQADWWSTLARMLNQRKVPAALDAARRAMALWRRLQRPVEHQFAAAQWVRAITEPGPELDQACAELQAVTAAFDATPRELLRLHGALAEAGGVRGDMEAMLASRLQEFELARAMRWPEMMQAAESNVCYVLGVLGRHAESAQRGRQLLLRVDADGGDANGNLPWVLNSLIEALLALGELAQAQALAPRAVAACQRFATGVAWPAIVQLAVARQRFAAAARLIGYVRQLYAAADWKLYENEQTLLARAQQAAVDALGATQTDALMMRGSLLSDSQALAEAADAPDGTLR